MRKAEALGLAVRFARLRSSMAAMGPDAFNEPDFFAALAASGTRVLLIGRRAMIAFGIPVLTADYDLWAHIDDIAALNAALEPLDPFPDRTPEEARRTGRHVLENGEKVDVMVARGLVGTGFTVTFVIAWFTRRYPTAEERLAYARRAYARWKAAMPPG
jgi:hypothetical protein